VIVVGAVIFASSPEGNFWDWRPMLGIFVLGSGMGFGAASTYKWLPKVFPHNTGPIGGTVGAIGAVGGFVLASILGAMGGKANSVHLFTGISLTLIGLDFILKAYPTIDTLESSQNMGKKNLPKVEGEVSIEMKDDMRPKKPRIVERVTAGRHV
jgi:nitrate/nitrite transporter NarK